MKTKVHPKARITVETSTEHKDALDSILDTSGLSLPEWIDLRIEEEAAPYQSSLLTGPEATEPLVDLASAKDVVEALNRVDWAFEKASTAYLSHDIHPYPAKFIPQIPRHLVSLLSRPGELVWDPFGGSGTTALEATLAGRRCISTDVNPLAGVIGRAKTVTLTTEEDHFLAGFADEIRSLATEPHRLEQLLDQTHHRWKSTVPEIPNLDSWFHAKATQELAYLRWRITSFDSEPCASLASAALSRSILRASYQDSETRYVSKHREVERGETLQIFATHLQSAQKKVRSLGPLLHFRRPIFQTLDLRTPLSDTDAVGPDSVDLIVTSPPYPNATDYHLYHRFRLFWLGFDPRPLANKEIGSHLRHQKQRTGFKQYIEEMQLCLHNIHSALRPSRFAVMVIGDAVFEKKIHRTAEEVAAVAVELGFEHVATLNRKVHSTKRSFVSAARRLGSEQLVVLRKPNDTMTFRVVSPRYTPWPYEQRLRTMELQAVAETPVVKVSGDDLAVELPAHSAHRLRRLTFSRMFRADHFNDEPTWQTVLENGDAGSSSKSRNRKDPKYVTHGIHPYKGKFYPQLAKALFNLAGASAGSKVLDPFCGSGTVLLEAYLNGLNGTGLDVNPLAVKVARAKIDILAVDPYKRDKLLAKFEDRLAHLSRNPRLTGRFSGQVTHELQSWFAPLVLEKLNWVLDETEQVGDPYVRELLEVLVSSIVREVSHQDPKDLRIRRRKEPLSDAPVGELLRSRVKEVRSRLRHFAEICNWAPERFGISSAVCGDSRVVADIARAGLEPKSVDLVVTSPPYATALPYIDTDRLSLLLLQRLGSPERQALEATLVGNREIRPAHRAELDRLIEQEEFAPIPSVTGRRLVQTIYRANKNSHVGFRRKNTAALLYLYFSQMMKVMANVDGVLRPGAYAFFVIGDNRTTAGTNEVVIRSGHVLQELGEALGWSIKDVIPISVTQEDRLHSRNSITENEIIWFAK